MKLYAFISVCLVFAFIACRSNKDLHKISEVDSEIQSGASTHSKDSTATTTSTRDSISDIASERQYIRTTWYRPDGTIRKIQEEGRETERARVAVSDTGSSDVSVSENKIDSTAVTKAQSKEVVHEDTDTDSRPVQGNEWGWFAGAFVLVVVVFYIRYRRAPPTSP
jgi:hypothetical protein